jgi:3-oxoacyl-[acyl-carrier protein] reductase
MDRKVVVVTGAAGGMGIDVARSFGAAGYAVGLIDRRAEPLAALAAELKSAGITARPVAGDVADRRAMETAFSRFAAELGPVTTVAATAGILAGAPICDGEDALFDDVWRVNVRGIYIVNSVAAQMMVAAGTKGRIINWSGLGAHGGTAGYAAYNSSKAAVEALTKCLALELAPSGITVNALVCGRVMTPMVDALEPERRAAAVGAIPLGRWGEPRDISKAALFLASDDAAWITGSMFAVDGGSLAKL